MLQRFALNTEGRDLAVGDIHGHYTLLMQALEAVEFNPMLDRLFATGDLIDRGPESLRVLELLKEQWFNSVRGNHDDCATNYKRVDWSSWAHYGGYWFQCLDDAQQAEVANICDTLPFAFEIETSPGGFVGIVHADPIVHDWLKLRDILEGEPKGKLYKRLREGVMHSRSRYELEDIRRVGNVRAVVVGHQPVGCRVTLGNVHYIDTAGWRADGHFTLLNLNTLLPEPVRTSVCKPES